MKWFIIGIILGTINWIIIKKFIKVRIRRFRPIYHHGGILGILPLCGHCTYQINGLGIQTGSRFPLHNYYHIPCWFKYWTKK
jgi:hypothetical protein